MYWKIASLLMIIIFCFWVRTELSLKTRKDEKEEEKFWEREREANAVRRKPIDHLDYIKIPEDLPYGLPSDNQEIPSIMETIEKLKGEKILNLTGYTNTDLKLEYGAANLTDLSLYDDNFTLLITTLQKWADILYESGMEEEAVKVMEFMVSVRADIGKTYRMLGKYYLNNSKMDKYEELIKISQSLKSMNASNITESIKDLLLE